MGGENNGRKEVKDRMCTVHARCYIAVERLIDRLDLFLHILVDLSEILGVVSKGT